MANRVLRDWTDSFKIDNLSFGAEVFFVRLFMKADDYGCFHANPKLLKSALFPLKELSLGLVEEWLEECVKNELLTIYTVNNVKYLEIKNFGQRLRTMNRKFPENSKLDACQTNDSNSPSNDSNSPSNDSNSPPERKGNEGETKLETKLETEVEDESLKQDVKVYLEIFPKSKLCESFIIMGKFNRERFLRLFETFGQYAKPEYANLKEFGEHYRNWYNKQPKEQQTPYKPKRRGS